MFMFTLKTAFDRVGLDLGGKRREENMNAGTDGRFLCKNSPSEL